MSQTHPIEQPVQQNMPLDPLDKSYLFAQAAPFTNQTLHLTPLQHRAALLLAQGNSYPQVADQLNVGRATLYRWRNDPHFAAILNQQARQTADHTSHCLLNLLAQSLQTLSELINQAPTTADKERHAYRLLNLYTRPAFLRHLHSLPTDPLAIADQQIAQSRQYAGLPPLTQSSQDCYFHLALRQQQLVERAQLYDQNCPNHQLSEPCPPGETK